MLDDLRLIHERDKNDALGMAEKQWQQLLCRFNADLGKIKDFDSVLLCATDSSITAINFLASWCDCPIPLIINQNSKIPSFVGPKTLVIVADYLGETKLVLSMLAQAEIAGAKVLVISTDSELLKKATKDGHQAIELPDGANEDFASLFFIKALATAFDALKLSSGFGLQAEEAVEALKLAVGDWRSDVAAKNNPAKKLALELVGKSVVVTSGHKMLPVAGHLKSNVNRYARNLAWFVTLPSYDDFMGWTSQPLHKPYVVVQMRSEFEEPDVQKYYDNTQRLLSGRRPAPYIVEPNGKTLAEQLLWGVVFADFVAIYLSILNGMNPLAAEILEKLSAELNKT